MCSVMADHIESTTDSSEFLAKEEVLEKIRADWEFCVEGSPSPTRSELFQRIVTKARDLLEEHSPTLHELDDIRKFYSWTVIYRELYRRFIKESRARLAKLLSKLGFVRFFFAFDECGYLSQGRRPVLKALIMIIDTAKDFAHQEHGVFFWHLLLDTSPTLFKPPPSKVVVPSGRSFGPTEPGVLRTWTHMSLNSMAPGSSDKIEIIKTPRHALYLAFLKSYGRPVRPISKHTHII